MSGACRRRAGRKGLPALRSAVLVLLSAAALSAAGCGTREGPDPDREPPPVTIRFAYQDRVADAASIIAVARDLFAEEGVHVQPFIFSSGPACAETLVAGGADIGTMGDTTAVIAVSRSPVKIIASHGGGEHRHRIIVAGSSPIRSPSDLVGRRLAIKKGTSTYGGLLSWADSAGLDLSEVTVIDMRPQDMGDALHAGAVDAIVASEPTPSLVEDRGGRELATLGGLGNNYPILLVARTEFLREHPDAVIRFLRALLRAADIVDDTPDEAAQIIAAKTGLSPALARRAMAHHYYRVQVDPLTQSSLAATSRFLLDQQIISTAPDLSLAIDHTLLQEAAERDVPEAGS